MKIIQIAAAAPVVHPNNLSITRDPGSDAVDTLYALCENGRVAVMDFTQEEPGWGVLESIPDDLFE